MRLLILSDAEAIDLFKGLELLTNAAKVTLSSINVDESRHEITIPMKRRSFERKRFLLFGERYKLLSSDLIDSNLIIRNVLNHKITDNLHLTDILILFGVSIKNKEIILCSAEDQSGETAFVMSIKVQTYDIELLDENKQIYQSALPNQALKLTE